MVFEFERWVPSFDGLRLPSYELLSILVDYKVTPDPVNLADISQTRTNLDGESRGNVIIAIVV